MHRVRARNHKNLINPAKHKERNEAKRWEEKRRERKKNSVEQRNERNRMNKQKDEQMNEQCAKYWDRFTAINIEI